MRLTKLGMGMKLQKCETEMTDTTKTVILQSFRERSGSMRIGIPGLGGRLRRARDERGLTQEAVAEVVGVSWMTVLRWEHEQRSIPEERLKRLAELYEKPLLWFLTPEEGDLDGPDARYKIPRRLYKRIAEAPEKYQAMIERVVTDILEGVEGPESPAESQA